MVPTIWIEQISKRYKGLVLPLNYAGIIWRKNEVPIPNPSLGPTDFKSGQSPTLLFFHYLYIVVCFFINYFHYCTVVHIKLPR